MRPGFIFRSIFSFALLGNSIAVAQSSPNTDSTPIHTIAFGSCLNQNFPQPIWQAVLSTQPQIFIFLGDNIYADGAKLESLRKEYAKLESQPFFQKLKQQTRILGIWDDHDFGGQDLGAEYEFKEDNKTAFLEFFEASKDDIRRSRPGIYDAKVFGPEGKRVQIILLDTRTFRGPLIPDSSLGAKRYHYLPNQDPKVSFLGEAQWQWLEEQLKVPAELRIIGSSVQVLAQNHGLECWGNFPHERAKLFELLKKTNAQNVLLISGDRHFAEISRAEGVINGPLFDFTSSSLNTDRPEGGGWNALRVGDPYLKKNFGLINIKWENGGPQVLLTARDPKNQVKIEVSHSYQQSAQKRPSK